MALKFGTSGVRGLETELTDGECSAFARAFIRHFESLGKAAPSRSCVLAGDLRRSTPRIMDAIAAGLAQEGYSVLDAAVIPTPALAYECASRKLPGIMVTGSHIPADRNGIKFYFPWGEVLKEDEAPILAQLGKLPPGSPAKPSREKIAAAARFAERYTSYFGAGALQGLKVVFYEHSSAARDIYPGVLEALGAQVVRIQRSSEFIPVDTEALENVQALAAQLKQHHAQALISTDGDGDRPLLIDDQGQVVRGDQIGVLAAQALRADSVSTPVSSSTALEATRAFAEIRRCRIGSPFVIASMLEALQSGKKRVVGYEANGGFLLGSEILSDATGARLAALPTRDCVLPVLLLLASARSQGKSLSQLVATLPPRYTESGLIRPFATDRSQRVLERLSGGGLPLFDSEWGARLGQARSMDQTDGVRVTFASGEILHFRPSGNAPEFRIYSEAATEARARELNAWAQAWVNRL
jgi:phosphomannomutase